MSSSSPDTPAHLLLTELRPTGRLFAGKQILPDGTIKSKPLIKRWRHQQVGFDTIKQLYDYVVKTQYDNAIIIRGLTEATSRTVLRRKHSAQEPNGFHDRGAALLPFDIDDIAVGAWMANPRKTVEGIVRRLGKPFTETSYVAQLTGTHGLVRDRDGRWNGEIGGDVMSVRLFFITEVGISAEECEVWLELLRDTQLPEIDAALGRRVQIIYLARPLWHGHDEDPLGDIRPCWMVKRKLERLPVPDNLGARTRWQRNSKQIIRKKRIEPGDCSDAQAAVNNIGKPLSGDEGQGVIYDWLQYAGRLLAAAYPIDGDDEEEIKTHAWKLRDRLAQMVTDAWDRIVENLCAHERPNDAPLIEKYLNDDLHRWIGWLFEHGGVKKVRRGKQVRHEEIHIDVLDDKRALLDLIGETDTNNFDALYESRDAVKLHFEELYEAEMAKRQAREAMKEARKAKTA